MTSNGAFRQNCGKKKRESHLILRFIMASSNKMMPLVRTEYFWWMLFRRRSRITVILKTQCARSEFRRRVTQICWWVMMMSVGGKCQHGTRTSARNLQIEREEVDDWFLSAKRHDKNTSWAQRTIAANPSLMPWTVFEGSSCMVFSL
jgi:hypothetical protein